MPTQDNPKPKTALVLAGGGLTGALYEIGALRAIDDLLVDRTVNDFDIFVGTSAGALVAGLLASGLNPETIMQSIQGEHPQIPPITRSHLFHFNPYDMARLLLKLPKSVLHAITHYMRNRDDMTMFDVVWSLSEALPSGLYDNLAMEEYLRGALEGCGLSNRFDDLDRELAIIATDMDNGERVVFSRDSHIQIPISLAVAASTALPIVYKPVRIAGHDYADGGLRGNASLDLAIERGAELIICINPLVPFDNSDLDAIPFLGRNGGHLADKGLPAIGSQVLRILTHSGLHYHIKQLSRTHPEVDIIVIEPSHDDYQMFFYNPMRYSARLIVGRHGFESVTLSLAQDYALYRDLLARHGIKITRSLVIEELRQIQDSDQDPEVIREVLERHSRPRRRRMQPCSPVGRLEHTLRDLDAAIAGLSFDREPPEIAPTSKN